VEALEEAIMKYGTPDIFNTDQGSQFTSDCFTGILKAHGIKISMDGNGRWRDNSDGYAFLDDKLPTAITIKMKAVTGQMGWMYL
jgi:transposase InsO family protein